MIIETMNSEELYNEVMKDFENVKKKSQYFIPVLKRLAKKSIKKFVQKIYEYSSPCRNNWLIFMDGFVKECIAVFVVYYYTKNGLNAIMINDNGTLTHYNSHFFIRYNERFSFKNDVYGIELIKTFITNNSNYITEEIPSKNNDFRIFGKLPQGIGLGYNEPLKRSSINHMKTFISNSMLMGNQIAANELLTEKFDKYWEEVYALKLRKLRE